jgi:hypothetical protein
MQSDKKNLSERRKRKRAPASPARIAPAPRAGQRRAQASDARRPTTRAGQRRAPRAAITGGDHPAAITRPRSPNASQVRTARPSQDSTCPIYLKIDRRGQVSAKSAPSQRQVSAKSAPSQRQVSAKSAPSQRQVRTARDTRPPQGVAAWGGWSAGHPHRLLGDVLENRRWAVF